MMEQLTNFFISNAYADVAAQNPTAPQSGLSFLMMFVIFFLFIYFAIWRPQNKRAREQQTLLGSLTKGDEVMTAGGLIGRIAKITDQHMVLTVAPTVELLMQKSAVVSVLPKGTIKSIE